MKIKNVGSITLELENGTTIAMNDEGFTVSNIPNRKGEIKTTEWVDWLHVNDCLRAFQEYGLLSELEAWLLFKDMVAKVCTGEPKRQR